MDKPILATCSLVTGYDRRRPLSGPLNLGLMPGTVTVLIGANGCGKSTLLRTLCGVQPALGGTVEIGGIPLEALPPRRRAKLVSLTTTSERGGGGLTVSQAVALGRHPHTGLWGRLDAADRAIVAQAAETAGIAPEMALRTLHSLSDGERQKVMIARALAQQAPLMVLDEPTTFLDVAARLDVMALLRRLAAGGTTILLATHDVAEALDIATHAWLMHPDGTVAHGSVDSLIAGGAFNRVFSHRGIGFDPQARTFTIKSPFPNLC